MKQRRAMQIRRIFWDAKEVPYANKASHMLGDLSVYGVGAGRCMRSKRW